LPGDPIWLVSPVYFDVESYSRLRENVRVALADAGLEIRFVAIDDTAGADPDMRRLESLPDQIVLTPPFPLGHQRALVFGLRRMSSIAEESDLVVTLDADGEDKPEDLTRLVAALRQPTASVRTVVVAARTRRRESPAFKVLYLLFKNLFQLLTGTVIRSGNYAAYRGWMTRNVLFHPHFDLAYSSSLLSLGLNVQRVPCERGSRYAGTSKMGYVKLIQHGLRMLMPFADRIATRGLIILASLLGLGLLGGAVLLGLRALGFASPGWIVYLLCTAMLLCALGSACMVIVFALFVQTQSLSLSQLDAGLREREIERTRAPARHVV
jgi:polyisoprenyl-phosphate glycosyltransferase